MAMSPHNKILLKMALFGTGILTLGPAGGVILMCLSEAIPNLDKLVKAITDNCPDLVKELAKGGGGVIAGFLGERLGGHPEQYRNLREAGINHHLARTIVEVWEKEFERLSQEKSKSREKLKNQLFNSDEALKIQVQEEFLKFWAGKFKHARTGKDVELLEEIFMTVSGAQIKSTQKVFEIIQDEKEAERLLWENLKTLLVKWAEEKAIVWEEKEHILTDYYGSVWWESFETEIKDSFFVSLQEGVKRKVKNDPFVRDSFFYTSFFHIVGLMKQADQKNEFNFIAIKDKLDTVIFDSAQRKITSIQLFQYLEQLERQNQSLYEALSKISVKLFDVDNFAAEIALPTREEVIRYFQRVADDAAKTPLKLGDDGGVGFDRIRQKVEVSERKDRDPFLAQSYEQMRKSGTEIETDRKAYSRKMPHQSENNSEQCTEKKVIEWNEEAAAKYSRAVILGDPGFGKTWLLCYEARRIALAEKAKLESSEANLDDVVLPIRVRLSNIARCCPTKTSRVEIAEVLADLASHKDAQLVEPFSENFRQWVISRLNLEQKKCVLLLDALDEVPTETDEGINKQILIKELREFAGERRDLRILVTSRIVGYTEAPLQEADELELVWFENAQINDFVRIWFETDKGKADRFKEILDDQPQVYGLAQIPLMLTLLCKLFSIKPEDKDFPKTKSRIYEECLEGLLDDWRNLDKGEEKAKNYRLQRDLKILARAAYELFVEEKEQFRQSAFYKKLCEALEDEDKADKFLEEYERKGVLVKATNDRDPQMRFLHLTFQEYLAASHLAEKDWENVVYRENILYDPNWNDVLQLLGGKLEGKAVKRYITRLLEINGENGEGDVFFRPFKLAMMAAVEAGKTLDDDFRDQLMLNTLERFFEPPEYLDNKDFIQQIKRWGKDLSKFILPNLRAMKIHD